MVKLLWTYYTIMLRKLFVRPFGEVQRHKNKRRSRANMSGKARPKSSAVECKVSGSNDTLPLLPAVRSLRKKHPQKPDITAPLGLAP
jgi:hypothetical protein